MKGLFAYMKTKKITLLGVFTALALIIYIVESFLPPLAPIPGIKLGLSNVVTLVLLLNYSKKRNLFGSFGSYFVIRHFYRSSTLCAL